MCEGTAGADVRVCVCDRLCLGAMGPKLCPIFLQSCGHQFPNILQGIKQTLTDNSDRLNIFDTHSPSHTPALARDGAVLKRC